MMRKTLAIACIASVCLLCGCSSINTDKAPTSQQMASEAITEASDVTIESSVGDSIIKRLDGIHIWEGELGSVAKDIKIWSLSYSAYNGEATPYSFTASGTFENEYVDENGLFSKSKGDNIFQWFENCEKQRYEPNHPNSDGLLITEYKPYSVKAFYTLYDSENNIINNVNDPLYDKNETECYYTLSENDFNNLKKMLDELRVIVESNK
ncbi:MAG: hypothetical protein IKN24_00830 [Lachnospiraceae bacterium]|nr:hypothetical protein [Lachnospiraceae bacterium]